MPLHSERRRRAERDEREAIEGRVWVDHLPARARVKIAGLWELVRENDIQTSHSATFGDWSEGIAQILRLEGGYDRRYAEPDHLAQTNDLDYGLDLIGAFFLFLHKSPSRQGYVDPVRENINRTLEDFRVPYRLVDDSVVSLSSDELHEQVVLPALGLLVGERFAGANEAYIKALQEQDPADAITDAGTALQSVLTVLGFRGNALGPLIKDARKRGVLAGHDARLADGIVNFMEWASANRSERGDNHHSSDAERSDAWLMIHVVGAIIVRLLEVDGTDPGEQVS